MGFVLFTFTVILLWHPSRTQTFHSYQGDIKEKADCQNVKKYGPRGTISNLGYPKSYQNHTSCSWIIEGKEGETITIRFDDLDIAEDFDSCEKLPCCTSNWLKIDSLHESEQYYCGQGRLHPDTYFSSSNSVRIKFHTANLAKSGRGFQLSYIIGSGNTSTCQDNEFHCSNNKCIPIEWRCNNQYECEDHSDENFCCPPDTLMCSLGMCYDPRKHCDGVIHCPDYSDELNCGYCAPNFTQCGPGSKQCYNPFIHRCNRILDCDNGEDERDCTQGCQGKMMCDSGSGCYSFDERCNAVPQCGDSSDEKNCGPDLCKPEQGRFLCNNKLCIREAWRCDRTNDCGDGSDETGCLKNSVITAAVMGSLICGLLLVIAVSCTCRLYSLRFMEQQQTAHYDTPLSRFGQEFFFRDPPPSYAVAVGEHHNLCVENLHYDIPPRHSQRRTRRPRQHHQPLSSTPSSTLDNILNHSCIVLSQSHSSLPSSLPAFAHSSENICSQSPPNRPGSISMTVASSVINPHDSSTDIGSSQDLQTTQDKNPPKSGILCTNALYKRGEEISGPDSQDAKASNIQLDTTATHNSLSDQHFSSGRSNLTQEQSQQVAETNVTPNNASHSSENAYSEVSFNDSDTQPLIPD